jgi:hypothetical protein
MRALALAAIVALVVSEAPAKDASDGVPQPPASVPQAASTCEAPALSWLVGRPKSEIPVPVDPTRRRVYCDACPVSDEVRPDRTDILFDANTGIITEVKCG